MREFTALAEAQFSDEVRYQIQDLIDAIKAYNPRVDEALIRKAYEFSDQAHRGQFRRSGEEYIYHPLGVAMLMAELHLDTASIITALLHDTVEDTAVTLDDVEKNFGATVRNLVDGVTKLSKMRFRHTHEKQGENVRKMIVAMGKDIRVVLVKLADRLHNMRTLHHMPYNKQERIAQETLDIYAPLASRLGISAMKVELEDLSFRYIQPELYYELVQKVAKKKKEREQYIQDVIALLTEQIQSRVSFKVDVQGRPKHFYSIYKKMAMRNVDYDQVYDLLAFRVCVSTLSECYEVLGIVHSLYKPIPGRFKDFIAMPKANNYQSLHTTVVGPQAERIEVQIRTHQMHEIAEMGIAAHWAYKEEAHNQDAVDESLIEKFNWLRELVNLHKDLENPDEFLENVKTDLADSDIYVFTPKGEVREFPDGATPIDFAYAIHTDVGHRVMAARVNGKIVPLKYNMQNGDTVEIITAKHQKPSKDWLKMCVTTRAKSKIRAFVTAEQRQRACEMGKELLERQFRRAGSAFVGHTDSPLLEKFMKDQGLNNIDDLFIRVGYGKLTPLQIVEIVLPPTTPIVTSEDEAGYIQRAFKSAVKKASRTGSLVQVDGMSDVLVRYARCCNPIPGDAIVGFITLGRGITIHRADCEKSFEMDQDRRVDVDWNQQTANEESSRNVKVRVVSHDWPGLLKQMTEVFSSFGVNILNAQIRTTRDKKAICLFDVNVRDRDQLSQVMLALQKIKGILGVTRLAGLI